MPNVRTVEPGTSTQESAITLLRDAAAALLRHPRDGSAQKVASRITGLLSRFPTHFVVEYLAKTDTGAELRRVPLSDWPDWSDGLMRAIGLQRAEPFDLVAHLERQRAWSAKTFGPGERTAGVLDHIRKELLEVEADPSDVKEWVDLVILALDGAWRAGHEPREIVDAIVAKQTKNEGRTWPDWRTADPTKAIEHDRSGEITGDGTGEALPPIDPPQAIEPLDDDDSDGRYGRGCS